jgi:hypothetical protein
MNEHLKLLPIEFSNFKRSIIKKSILDDIDALFILLNNTKLYNKTFTKSDIVNYINNIGNKNYEEAKNYIPDVDYNFFLKEMFDNANTSIGKEKEEIDKHISYLIQSWDAYLDRIKVKNKVIDSYDIESTGFPDLSRGSVCSNFIPGQGLDNLNCSINNTILLTNPRNKKTIHAEILRIQKNRYECKIDNKIYYLIDREEIVDAYSALFSINKEIYSGWWNRTLIAQQIAQ